MKFKHLQLLILLILAVASCKDEEVENIWDETNLFIEYADSEFELNSGGALYLYDIIDGEYYYCLMFRTSGPYVFGWGIDDTYSTGDYIKLHFKGDSVSYLSGLQPLIYDSNSYVMIGYDKISNSFLVKDGIISGYLNFKNYGNFPNHASFEGKTEAGESVLINNIVTGFSSSYKIDRQILGRFKFQDTDYELSFYYALENEDVYSIKFGDVDFVDSVRTELTLIMKKDNNTLEGIYYGEDSGETNSFVGDMKISNIEGERLYYEFFKEGKININKVGVGNYRIEYNLYSADNDSIIGNWESYIEFHN